MTDQTELTHKIFIVEQFINGYHIIQQTINQATRQVEKTEHFVSTTKKQVEDFIKDFL